MPDLDFQGPGALRQAGEPSRTFALRRWICRLLQPVFQKQLEILQAICTRLDSEEWATVSLQRQVQYVDGRVDTLSSQMRTTVALGWDYVATVRRLAVLEDRVEALMVAREQDEGDASASVPFVGVHAADRAPTGTEAP